MCVCMCVSKFNHTSYIELHRAEYAGQIHKERGNRIEFDFIIFGTHATCRMPYIIVCGK